MKLLFIIVICFLPVISCATENDNVYNFVFNLYTNYQNDTSNTGFNSLGSSADTIYSTEILKLIRLDQKNAQNEGSYLNWDPLCDCQDDDGLVVDTIITYVKKGVTKAKAFTAWFEGMEKDSLHPIRTLTPLSSIHGLMRSK